MTKHNKKLAEILEEKGLGLNQKYGGSSNSDEVTEREQLPYEPTSRAKKLMDLYYQTLASTSTEWTYWYTRKYDEMEGEIQIVRRAHALANAFKHVTTSIYPGEILEIGRASCRERV